MPFTGLLRVPVSRIAFALGDLRNEVMALLPEDIRETTVVTLCMDPIVYDRVVSELQYRHHGAKLQVDADYHGPGKAIRYAGMRLVMVPLR